MQSSVLRLFIKVKKKFKLFSLKKKSLRRQIEIGFETPI